MNTALSQEQIAALLKQDTATECSMGHKIPEQHGPMRHYDRTMRCASRGCGSPTHFKLQGISYCMIHCLRKMNDMLVELGVEQ